MSTWHNRGGLRRPGRGLVKDQDNSLDSQFTIALGHRALPLRWPVPVRRKRLGRPSENSARRASWRPLYGDRFRWEAAGLDEEINAESLRAAALRRYLECGGFEDHARAIAGDLSLNVERYVVSTLKRSIREEIERLRF